MTHVKKSLHPQSKHFQRLYSGYGIDNPKPSEEFWQSLWDDKPRICIVDLIDTFRVDKKEQSIPSENAPKNEVDFDFTNSKKFSLGKWRKNDFFNLKCNGAMTCSRHSAHMKHLERFDYTRLKKLMQQKMMKKTRKH